MLSKNENKNMIFAKVQAEKTKVVTEKMQAIYTRMKNA
jgi:hypothetical protein